MLSLRIIFARLLMLIWLRETIMTDINWDLASKKLDQAISVMTKLESEVLESLETAYAAGKLQGRIEGLREAAEIAARPEKFSSRLLSPAQAIRAYADKLEKQA
jgi:hypothetical protein